MCDNRMFFVFVLLADAGAGSVPALGERPLPVVLYAHFPVLCDNRMFFVFQLLADAGAGSVPALGERPRPMVLSAHFQSCVTILCSLYSSCWQMPARAAYLLWVNVLGPWFFLPISSPV